MGSINVLYGSVIRPVNRMYLFLEAIIDAFPIVCLKCVIDIFEERYLCIEA